MRLEHTEAFRNKLLNYISTNDTVDVSVDGGDNKTNGELILITVSDLTDINEWHTNPTGIFAFAMCLGRFAECLSPNCYVIIHLPDWWETNEGYSHYFSGLGIYPPINNNMLFTVHRNLMPNNECKLVDWKRFSKIWTIDKLSSSLLDISTRKQLTFTTNTDWLSPRTKLKTEAKTLLRPYKDYCKIAIHARLPWHYNPEPDHQVYYDSLVAQVCAISKRFQNKIVCFVSSDNSVSLTAIADRLHRKNYNVLVSKSDVTQTLQDWYYDGKTVTKYEGAIVDAVCMSLCDYIIGGPSNVLYYALSLNNHSNTVVVPRILRKATCK